MERKRAIVRSPLIKQFQPKDDLEAFAENVLEQISHTIAVTPFIVVPADQFEESVVQANPRAGIKNGRGSTVNEIGADHLGGQHRFHSLCFLFHF